MESPWEDWRRRVKSRASCISWGPRRHRSLPARPFQLMEEWQFARRAYGTEPKTGQAETMREPPTGQHDDCSSLPVPEQSVQEETRRRVRNFRAAHPRAWLRRWSRAAWLRPAALSRQVLGPAARRPQPCEEGTPSKASVDIPTPSSRGQPMLIARGTTSGARVIAGGTRIAHLAAPRDRPRRRHRLPRHDGVNLATGAVQ